MPEGAWLPLHARTRARRPDVAGQQAMGVTDQKLCRAGCPRSRGAAGDLYRSYFPLQHPQSRVREMQFRLGTPLQHSITPSLRVAGFEDEDDDEDENEASRGAMLYPFTPPTVKPSASSVARTLAIRSP
jgi:hypothetical protein